MEVVGELSLQFLLIYIYRERVCMCVCVYVCKMARILFIDLHLAPVWCYISHFINSQTESGWIWNIFQA